MERTAEHGMAKKLFTQAVISCAAVLLLAGCGSDQQEPAVVVAKPTVKEPAIKRPVATLPAAAVERPVAVEKITVAAEQSPTLADDSSAPAAARVR